VLVNLSMDFFRGRCPRRTFFYKLSALIGVGITFMALTLGLTFMVMTKSLYTLKMQ